jgi:hypothetical protein
VVVAGIVVVVVVATVVVVGEVEVEVAAGMVDGADSSPRIEQAEIRTTAVNKPRRTTRP